jgi:hypothetical protein
VFVEHHHTSEMTKISMKMTSGRIKKLRVPAKVAWYFPIIPRLQPPLSHEKTGVELEALTKLKVEKWMASLKKAPPPTKSAKELEAEGNIFGTAKKANVVKL